MIIAIQLVADYAVGPSFERPQGPAVDAYTRGRLPSRAALADEASVDIQRFVQVEELPAQWWTCFIHQL